MSDDVEGKVNKRVKSLINIKKEKDAGKIFCIPFVNYPKLTQSVPGIIPGMMTLITAASGIGKTQVAKALAVREPLEYCLKHGKKIKIIYFALEESREEFIDTMICNYISGKGIRVDLLTLQGYKEKSLDQNTLDAISKYMPEIEKLLENVDIVDSIYNATGMYKYCRDFADRNGKHFYEDREFIKSKKDGTTERIMTKVYSHYTPNDPDLNVIVICDHLSLISPEKDPFTGNMMTQHQAMAKWSTDYAMKQITKHWGWSVVDIQQQEQSAEKEQFTNKGESIQKKTEPSSANLANNKELQRNYKVILGVYSPDRYGFEDYHGYDIRRFKDTFRSIIILKNRFGPPNKYYSFLFDGATNRFNELPRADEVSLLAPFYNKADILLGRTGQPRKPPSNFGMNG